MSDHSWFLGARALRDTGPRRSWDPLTWHQHYQWSINAQGPVGPQGPQSQAITGSAKRLSPCPGLPTWLYATGRKYCVKVTSLRACLICAHIEICTQIWF